MTARPPDPSEISIIIVNNYCHAQGGGSRVAIDAAVGLAKAGWRVIFFGAVGPTCEELLAAPLKTICLEQPDLQSASLRPGVLKQGLWNAEAYRALGALLTSMDPKRTIVHLHGFTQALSASPARCAIDHGVQVLYTMHEFFAACPICAGS